MVLKGVVPQPVACYAPFCPTPLRKYSVTALLSGVASWSVCVGWLVHHK